MEYGPSIRNSALRHAILADLSGVEVALTSPLSKEICQYHTFIATRKLQATLQEPEKIDVGDMCATYLLAGLQEYGTPEGLIHSNGCIAVCNHLSSKFGPGDWKGLFGLLAPLIVHKVREWSETEVLIQASASPTADEGKPLANWLPFEQRLASLAGFGTTEWPALESAAGDLLFNYVYLLDCFVISTVKGQMEAKSFKTATLRMLLEAIKIEAYNPILQDMINQTAEEFGKARIDYTGPKNRPRLAIYSYFNCLRLQILILESPNVLEILRTSQLQALAFKSIFCHRAAASSCMLSLRLLRLAAIALPRYKDPERISFTSIADSISSFRVGHSYV